MSDVKLYDKVKLKDGRDASIVEILGEHEAYIADIDIGGDYETDTIYPDELGYICDDRNVIEQIQMIKNDR